jgi:hypothetical protein
VALVENLFYVEMKLLGKRGFSFSPTFRSEEEQDYLAALGDPVVGGT